MHHGICLTKIRKINFLSFFVLSQTMQKAMKYLSILLVALLLISCGGDDNNNPNNNNPNLTEPLVNFTLNLNLPEYNSLRFPGNSVTLNGQGIQGVIVYNVNNSLYTAFDLACPNIPQNSCARMEVTGVVATCPCGDENTYDIVTGSHQSDEEAFPMLQYFAQREGDIVTVSN